MCQLEGNNKYSNSTFRVCDCYNVFTSPPLGVCSLLYLIYINSECRSCVNESGPMFRNAFSSFSSDSLSYVSSVALSISAHFRKET